MQPSGQWAISCSGIKLFSEAVEAFACKQDIVPKELFDHLMDSERIIHLYPLDTSVYLSVELEGSPSSSGTAEESLTNSGRTSIPNGDRVEFIRYDIWSGIDGRPKTVETGGWTLETG